ncbi:MAG: hypothetical protein KGS48_08775 [Bacteroidetes bacterium]|nr:hypothetical protein [Bacteroidota bacterium]
MLPFCFIPNKGANCTPKAGPDSLKSLDLRALAQVAEEIPSPAVPLALIQNQVDLLDLLSEHTGILASRSEAKKAIQNNAISINKEKVGNLDQKVGAEHLLHGQYIMIENGKKNKFLLKTNQ